jgi:sec-independent protein translocase protein TatB
MFGIGMSELLVILVIGLVVIGPKQLPEVARTLGKLFAQFKRTTNDLKDQVDREVKQFTEMEEVKEFKRSMEDELTGVKTEAQDFVQKQMEEGERLVSLEEDAQRAGPNHGDAGALASDTPAKTEDASGTANSVEFSSTRAVADGGLPPGKLPS